MNQESATRLALASGHLQTTIQLLHPALTEFVGCIPVFALKDRMDTSAKGRKQRKKKEKQEKDIAELLKIMLGCKNKKFVSHPLSRTTKRCLDSRNSVSHQNIDLEVCERALEIFIKLAILIRRPDLEKKIRSLVQHSLFCHGEQDEPIISPSSPQNPHGPANSDQSDTSAAACSNVSSRLSCIDYDSCENLKINGDEHLKNGEYTKAMILYSRAIYLNPKLAILYSKRALCHLRLQKFQSAREDAEDAIELEVSQIEYYRILSEALENLGLLDECYAVCNEGLEIDPHEDILAIRQRNCVAYTATQVTDKNPRPREQPTADKLASSLPCWIDKYQRLKPKPSDIEVLSSPKECLEAMRLCQVCQEAHQYHHGWYGKPEDHRQAAALFEAAGKDGSAEGLYNLALFYIRGLGDRPRDFTLMFECLRKAASQKPYQYDSLSKMLRPNIGVAEAENCLGNCHRDSRGVDEDVKEAFQWYLKSAEHGCPEGQNNLAIALRNGYGVEEDLRSARIWFQRAAAEGIAEAQVNYAEMLEEGLGGPLNVKESCDFYHKAANQGAPGALERLQRLHRRGALGGSAMLDTTLAVDSPSACALAASFSKALQREDPHALFLLGNNFYNGEGGVSKDLDRAETFWKKAELMGHVQAKAALAQLLINEKKRNLEGFEYMLQAAEAGLDRAQLAVGLMYAFGHGCQCDANKARRWMERASLQGVRFGSLGVETDPDPEKIIKHGKRIYDFERQSHLSTDGMTIAERLQRFYKSENECEILNDHLQYLSLPPPSPICEYTESNTETRLLQMIKRANEGSATAHAYLTAAKMINDSTILVTSGCVKQALARVRESYRYWDKPKFPDYNKYLLLSKAARTRFDENPNDTDAMYFIAANMMRSASLPETVRFLERCIERQPREADFHWLLGCLYGFQQKFEKGLHSIDRALELDHRPQWLYERASCLRLSTSKGDFKDAIAAYKIFLEANPTDHRKVPEAHYSLGMMFMLTKKDELAKMHWHKGQEAEDPAIRLPCVEPVGNDFPPREMLSKYIALSCSKKRNNRIVK